MYITASYLTPNWTAFRWQPVFMHVNNDNTDLIRERVRNASDSKTPLVITAGNSKRFYGLKVAGEPLSLEQHQGVLSYKASELVITARSGTLISDIESTLDEHGQVLAFEPPRHSDKATIGGAVASGLSGPARPFQGAARDFVLGSKIINGKGESMRFGGQVMKNVAGYDVSRLMVGAQGTLGVLTEISLKVLPRAEAEATLEFEIDAIEGHNMLRAWLSQGQPITASCHYRDILSVRLSSTENSIRQACKSMGGEISGGELWQQLRDQVHPHFQQDKLWRLSVPPAAELQHDDNELVEWGGALRWKVSREPLFEKAQQLGGHATRYSLNTDTDDEIFQPLQPTMLAIHQRIKHALDPNHILNPARLYKVL